MFVSFNDEIAPWRFDLVVKVRARTWESATQSVAWLRENPPAGYRMEVARLMPTTSSGRRCDVVVGLAYVDDREEKITSVAAAQARPSLILFAAMARSRDAVPSIPGLDPTSTRESASEGPTPGE